MSRFVPVAALVMLVAAACGGAARPHRSTPQGVPRALAQSWRARALAIADAAAAGKKCEALHLANSLREDVTAAEARVPSRLRSPLVDSVNALADRIVCKPPPRIVTVTQPPPKPKPPPKPHEHHHDHHHHGHGGGGDQ